MRIKITLLIVFGVITIKAQILQPTKILDSTSYHTCVIVSDTLSFPANTIEADTIYLSNSYSGKLKKYRFIIDRKHYQKATYIARLMMIPYLGLNDNAREELHEGAKYILDMQLIEPKVGKQRNKKRE